METTDQQDLAAEGADLTTRIIGILAELLHRDLAGIDADTRLFEDLGFDSTGVLELLMQLEDHFAVEFDPFQIEPRDFETVASVVRFTETQIKG